MKIAVAIMDNWTQVCGHASQARDWLVFDCRPGASLPEPQRVALADTRFDLSPTRCKLRDLFSRH